MTTAETHVQFVLNNYNLADAEYEEVRGGFNPNWKITSDDGEFFLKSRPATEYKKALTDSRFSKFLNSCKITTASPITSPEGYYIISKGNRLFSLFEFIDGKNYVDDEAHLDMTAKIMSRIHNATGYFSTLAFEETGLYWSKNCMNRYLQREEHEIKNYFLLAEKEMLSFSAELPRTYIHWDLHGGNMKFNETGCIPFDFEFVHKDYRIMDIANSLVCLAAMDQKNINYGDAETFIQKCELDLEKTKIFVSKYSSRNQLTQLEISALPAAMQIAWIGWTAYTLAKLDCSEKTVENSFYFPKWIKNNKTEIQEKLTGV